MKIEKKYSKIAVEFTYGKMKEANVELDATVLESFKSALGAIAAKKKYTEGQPLDRDDVKFVQSNMDVLINSAIKKHDKSPDSVKEHTSPHRYIYGVYFYLTALAMDALNCPEFPKNMGKDLLPKVTRRLIETRAPRQSAQEYFNKQRRKDFVDISDGIIKLIETLEKDDKKRDHKSLAELYGQYRALSERQANHTGIWRFFHREENENRNKLLALMESTLKERLPGGIIDLTKEPNEIYQDSVFNDYMSRINEINTIAEISPESAFGYFDYKNHLKPFPADKKQESIPKQKDQKNSAKEQKEQKNSAKEQKEQQEPNKDQQEQGQEQQEPEEHNDQMDPDQEYLLERLSGDLTEATTERLSKIEPDEIEPRANIIH